MFWKPFVELQTWSSMPQRILNGQPWTTRKRIQIYLIQITEKIAIQITFSFPKIAQKKLLSLPERCTNCPVTAFKMRSSQINCRGKISPPTLMNRTLGYRTGVLFNRLYSYRFTSPFFLGISVTDSRDNQTQRHYFS